MEYCVGLNKGTRAAIDVAIACMKPYNFSPSVTFDPSADVFLTCIPLPFMLGKNIILLIFVHLSTVVLGTSSDTGVIKPGWLENPLFIDDFLIKTSI